MNRREFVAAACSAGTQRALHQSDLRGLAVEKLEAFCLSVRRGTWLLFRLYARNGATGIGDASHGGDDRAVIEFARRLVAAFQSRSIFEIEYLRQRALPLIQNYGRPAAVALGGIEQCLWDLQGQFLGVPVYQLFGGALRKRIPVYANINRATQLRTPEGFARLAAEAVRAGFRAVKLAPFDGMPKPGSDRAEFERWTELGIACARAVREAIGPTRELLIDVHKHMDFESGLRLAQRLEPLRLYWLEEITPSVEDQARIKRQVRIPVAGGESLFGVGDFYRYIRAEAAHILMPDIKSCGGMLELKKIAAMAEGAGLLISPHGPASPVGNIAAAHVCATLPNFQILEYAFGEVPWRAELVEPPEPVMDGELVLGERPGFGFRLNMDIVRRYAVAGT